MIKKIFNKLLSRVYISFSDIEKNILSQNKNILSDSISYQKRHLEGTLADSLKQGEVTTEVEFLRWRMYKILKHSNNLKTDITDYDEDNLPKTTTYRVNNKTLLKKIKVDTFDKFELELVVDNSELSSTTIDTLSNDNINVFDEAKKNYDENGELISVTHGDIKFDEYNITNTGLRPLIINRESIPNFYIENFTKKLNVRKINNDERLLEFYVSKYPDEFNRTSRLFLSEIKKIIEENKKSTMLDLKSVYFITNKTVGVDDFLEFKYNHIVFDKIIEFSGHYVIKFKSKIEINGNDITNIFKKEELEQKYLNKEAKKK